MVAQVIEKFAKYTKCYVTMTNYEEVTAFMIPKIRWKCTIPHTSDSQLLLTVIGNLYYNYNGKEL